MIPEGVKTEASDAKVSSEFVDRHIQIGIEALRLIRRHGKSVRPIRFDECATNRPSQPIQRLRKV